jgi:hypothetical protein
MHYWKKKFVDDVVEGWANLGLSACHLLSLWCGSDVLHMGLASGLLKIEKKNLKT